MTSTLTPPFKTIKMNKMNKIKVNLNFTDSKTNLFLTKMFKRNAGLAFSLFKKSSF